MWVGLKHNGKLSDAGLANFKGCKNLTFLGLFDSNVSDAGLVNFQDCKRLLFLNLSQTKISDAGLAYFAECKDLATVVLTGTNVSDAGLAYLKNCRTPTQISLENTNVTAAGIQDLQKQFPFTRIVWDGNAPQSGLLAEHQPLPPTFKNNIGMEFAIVPKGKSWLGGGSGVVGEHGVETVHGVEIVQDFYLGKYEVTQEEWHKVMGENPSSFFRTGAKKDSVKDIADADLARFPVDNVSWDDCQEFITRLNERSKENGWVYRLPKQSEWEYACRGGPLADRIESTFDFYGEKPTNRLQPDQANILGKGRPCQVGKYPPNRLGLHDMHGNVWEWCEDAFDAKDPALAALRAIRGGCFIDDGGNCRAAVRHATAPSLRSHIFGLRVARVPAGAASLEAKTPPLAAAPFAEAAAKEHQEAWAKYLGIAVEFRNSVGMKLRLIPPGEFTMGNADENPFAAPEDKPQHRVRLTKPFYLGTHEVTVGHFREFVTATKTKTFAETDPQGAQVADVTGYHKVPGTNWRTPGFPQTDDHPVTCVTWAEATAFCDWLSKKEGRAYRLPTDAEWEYACRGGTTMAYYYGPKADPKMAAVQRWEEEKKTLPVGSFPTNPFGLNDMLGNVYEWCLDGRRKYTSETVTDPLGPTGPADDRVRRGGAWSSGLDQKAGAQSGGRSFGPPGTDAAQTIGFRIALVGPPGGK